MAADISTNYERKGCIIFKHPFERDSPGVAVFTQESKDLQDAPKRSVYFEYHMDDDTLTIKEFGLDFHGDINLSKEYIQLTEDQANALREEGKVTIPMKDCHIIKQESERRYDG